MNNQKGFIEYIIVILLGLFLVVGFFFVMVGFRLSPSGKGQHNGFITAVEQQGFFFPNYRIYVKTDNSSSQEDAYCMHRNKTELADKLRKYSANKTHVSVEYQGVRGFGIDLCWGEEVLGVKILK